MFVPYSIAFSIGISPIPLALEITLTLIYIIDIWVNYHSDHLNGIDGQKEDSRSMYLKTEFPFDLIAAVPISLILSGADTP